MLQWINDRVKVFGWIILLPLSLIFAVWGVHGIVDFTSNQDRGLKVNGEDVPVEQARLVYQERLAEAAKAYPDGMPDEVKQKIRDGVVSDLVATTLVDQKADSQHYAASDAEVLEAIRSNPAFQVGGVFNKDAYFALLQARNLTPERFETDERKQLKDRALEGGLYLSAFVTEADLKRDLALLNETRDVGYAILPLAKYVESAKPTPEQVKAYYDAHPDEFKTPDSVHLSYVALRLSDVTNEVAVDEAGLKAYYESVKDRFTQAEKRHARHILIQADKDDAAAQKKAADVYALATKPGADFAALAKQYSQDAGSAQQGGDLGSVEKSFFVGPFGDAVFSMKKGEIRGPVKTPFGYHVILLEDITPGATKSLAEVRAELEPQYKRSEAEKRYGDRQEKLEQYAFEDQSGLEGLAKKLNLKIEDVADFHKGLAGNDLAANAKVLSAAFNSDVLGGHNSRPIEVAPGYVVVVRARDRKAPVAEPLSAVTARAEAGAKAELARAAAKDAGQKLAAALKGGASWDAALKLIGSTATPAKNPAPAREVQYTAVKPVTRADRTVPSNILAGAFRLPAPKGSPSVGDTVINDGDVAVFAVASVTPGAFDAKDLAARRGRTNAVGTGELLTYLESLKSHAKVRVNPTLFD